MHPPPRSRLFPRPSALASAGVLVVALSGFSGCAALEDLNDSMNPQSTSVLDLFAPASPDQAARWALDPYSADNRTRGTLLLANASYGGEPPYLALFVDAITQESEPDPAVRAAAAKGLAHHGGPEHVPLLLDALQDPDRLVRTEAARALQRIYAPAAIDTLARRLSPDNEPDAAVRGAVADALGQYARPRVLDPLIAALRDPSLLVNERARDSLITLTGQDHEYSTRDWLRWIASVDNPFAGRTAYVYPVFERDRKVYEYIPIFQGPPNEIASTPIGFPSRELEALNAPPPTAPGPTGERDQPDEPNPLDPLDPLDQADQGG